MIEPLPPLPPPTPDLHPWLQLVGSREALLALIEHSGGLWFYVPTGAGIAGLAEIIGRPAAEHLAARCGGDRFIVPLGREWRAQILKSRGLSYRDIAIALGMTENGVYRSLRRSGLGGNVRHGADGSAGAASQLDLFD